MSLSKPTPVNIFQNRIILEIEKYDFHLIIFDKVIKEKIKTLGASRPDNIDSEDKYHYANWVESEIYDFFITNDLLYNNVITSYYSFLEHTLFDICNYMHKKYNLDLKVNDIRGDTYLDQSKKYIEKVIGFNFDSSLEMHWIKINELRLIRNCIVHNFSNMYNNQEFREFNQLTKREKRIVNIFKNTNNCDWDIKSGNFAVNLDFSKMTSKLVCNFLLDLTDNLCEALR